MISELALLWKLCIVALVAAAGFVNALPLGEKEQENYVASTGALLLAGPEATPTPTPPPGPTPTPPPQLATPTYAAVSSDGDISVKDPWDDIDSKVASATGMDIQDPAPAVDGAPEAPIEMPEWTWTLTFFKERPTTTVESTDEYGHASTRTVTHYKVVSQKNNKPKTMAPAPTGSGGTPRPTTWTLRKDYGSDLAADFGIKTWAWGKSLVTVLPSLPPQTSSYSVDPQPTAYPYVDPAKNTDRVLQVVYPSGSVNPAARPQGGVGFYAAPIDVSGSRNVSFSYSVYFPPDFDFVKGGKMPGLYGGHGGCSGGQESEDCFSTRLMFRKGGMGELYLYVPKGAQSASLCTMPPQTYCDTTYGYSIGRGAWIFKRGQWTDIRQDIWLNDPGKQNGGFNIWVNGQLALSNSQVMYRKAVQYTTKGQQNKIQSGKDPESAGQKAESADPEDSSLIESVIGNVGSQLGALRRRDGSLSPQHDIGPVRTKPRMGLARALPQYRNETQSSEPQQTASTSRMSQHRSATLKGSHNVWVTPQNTTRERLAGMHLTNFATKTDPKDVTFNGIMFDTFFGGSDPSWATTRDQQSFFNSLGLKINSWEP